MSARTRRAARMMRARSLERLARTTGRRLARRARRLARAIA